MSYPERPNFFDSDSVVWEVESTNKSDAIREIIQRAPVFKSVPDLDLHDFTEKVLDRERIQTTGFGHGVAVAHGRAQEVSRPTVALGISREGIDYDAFDGQPVHLLFIVANHPDKQMDYLQILSALITLVRNPAFRRELLECMTCAELQSKICSAFHELWHRSRETTPAAGIAV